MTNSGHPVGGKLDALEISIDRTGLDVGSAKVHQTLNNGHASGGSSRDKSKVRLLAHGHGFTSSLLVIETEAGEGDSNISNRSLPRTDKLITDGETADGTVTDGDKEVLRSD